MHPDDTAALHDAPNAGRPRRFRPLRYRQIQRRSNKALAARPQEKRPLLPVNLL